MDLCILNIDISKVSLKTVNKLVETGTTVNGLFEPVLPLTQLATKITLSNVPQFISDDFLLDELSRHGKVVSPMRKILSGCKSPLLKQLTVVVERTGDLGEVVVRTGGVVERTWGVK